MLNLLPLRGLPQMNRKYGLRTYSLHDTASHSHMRMRRGSRFNMATTVDDKIIHLTRAGSVPALDSTEIFQGGKEVVIRHGEELYRLRLTSSNKLILIK
jgi:hemin uptake protein HemP